MRTSRTAEPLDDERTPADNQPPVAPQYHAASIDLPRQALCPPRDQARRVWLAILAGPVVGAFGPARRASRPTENSASRAPSLSVALARSSWPVGQEEVRATTRLSTADAAPTPRQAGPAGRLLSRIIAVGLGCSASCTVGQADPDHQGAAPAPVAPVRSPFGTAGAVLT